MINELTKEQQDKLPKYFKKWDGIGKQYKKINEKKATELLKKYLALADIKPKYFIFLDSPMACQLAINILHKTDYFKIFSNQLSSHLDSQLRSQLRSQLDSQLSNQFSSQLDSQLSNQLSSHLDSQLYSQLSSQLSNQLSSQLDSQLRSQLSSQLYSQLDSQLSNQLSSHLDSQLDSQLYSQLDSQLYSQLDSQLSNQLSSQLDSQLDSQLYSQLDSQLRSQLRSQLDSQLDKIKLEYYSIWYFYQSGNINSGYNAFYDFVINEIIKPDEKTLKIWSIFTEISKELHYFFVFKDIVFCSQKPEYIKFNGNLLHSENTPSVKYKDGYSLYSWNGVSVPEKLIMKSELITKDDILKQDNAEVRRCFREKLGAKRYYDILTDGKGLIKIDTVTDFQSNLMTLWQTKEPDTITNKHIQFLECVDPSTGRIYNIYPPSQNCKTAFEAKYNTFNNEKLFYRQGDVGLVKIGVLPEHPLIET